MLNYYDFSLVIQDSVFLDYMQASARMLEFS